jgi:hypothetical protein
LSRVSTRSLSIWEWVSEREWVGERERERQREQSKYIKPSLSIWVGIQVMTHNIIWM